MLPCTYNKNVLNNRNKITLCPLGLLSRGSTVITQLSLNLVYDSMVMREHVLSYEPTSFTCTKKCL